ncbi:phosphoribosyltransferase-like protein [Phakopsora pachyrhizi]|nr:phosphoribosyltransferase-like protein [Phakopsora pachyrhizi]
MEDGIDREERGKDQPNDSPSEPYLRNFIKLAISNEILRFGDFKLKSGRSSPYFYNAGLFNTGLLLNAIGLSYARRIVEAVERDGLEFEVLFGPAYKGIPLAAITAVELNRIDPMRYKSVGVTYNRKEAKEHGEGGTIVGAKLEGRRTLVLDDVITAGTAIRESIELIRGQGGRFVGVVVNLDRQERSGESDRSAIEMVEEEFEVKVYAVLRLMDIISFMRSTGGFEEQLERMENYRQNWGIDQIRQSQ